MGKKYKPTTEVTILGYLMPNEWDDDDNVVSVAISTDDDYYVVELNGLGEEFFDILDVVFSGQWTVDEFVVSAAAVLRHSRFVSPDGSLLDFVFFHLGIDEVVGKDHPSIDVEAVEQRFLAVYLKMLEKGIVDLPLGIKRDGHSVGCAMVNGGQYSLFRGHHVNNSILSHRLCRFVSGYGL